MPFRIYLTANAIVYLFCALQSLPLGLLSGVIYVTFSLLFSLPSLLGLLVCFHVLTKYKLDLAICWLVLLLFAGMGAMLPLLLLRIDVNKAVGENQVFMYLSFGSAYGSILFQIPWIHRYFKSFQNQSVNHENY